uniref:Uncharacterized protein n=1 Tax=Arundo donax TaxID=35708 RepID=A0A0A9AGQ8_ARUDO
MLLPPDGNGISEFPPGNITISLNFQF